MIPPKLPAIADLREQLKKLESNPASIVLIALESFETRNECRVTTSWLSAEERKVLRNGLAKCREKRIQMGKLDKSKLDLS
jgi:hypothetical protein